jgi:hypothetical protein
VPTGDAGAVDQLGAFGSGLAAVHRGPACGLAAAGGLDDASVHGQVREFYADDAVTGLKAQLLELFEDSGGDPLVPPAPEGGGRAGGVGDLLAGGPEHEDLDELVEHDPVRDPRPVAAERVPVDDGRDQGPELGPQWAP